VTGGNCPVSCGACRPPQRHCSTAGGFWAALDCCVQCRARWRAHYVWSLNGVCPARHGTLPRGRTAHDPLVAVDLSGCYHRVWPGDDSASVCYGWDGAYTALSDVGTV
jgi:hypothetical protein